MTEYSNNNVDGWWWSLCPRILDVALARCLFLFSISLRTAGWLSGSRRSFLSQCCAARKHMCHDQFFNVFNGGAAQQREVELRFQDVFVGIFMASNFAVTNAWKLFLASSCMQSLRAMRRNKRFLLMGAPYRLLSQDQNTIISFLDCAKTILHWTYHTHTKKTLICETGLPGKRGLSATRNISYLSRVMHSSTKYCSIK